MSICHVCKNYEGATVHIDYCSFTGRKTLPSLHSRNFDYRYGFEVHLACLDSAQRKRMGVK